MFDWMILIAIAATWIRAGFWHRWAVCINSMKRTERLYHTIPEKDNDSFSDDLRSEIVILWSGK